MYDWYKEFRKERSSDKSDAGPRSETERSNGDGMLENDLSTRRLCGKMQYEVIVRLAKDFIENAFPFAFERQKRSSLEK